MAACQPPPNRANPPPPNRPNPPPPVPGRRAGRGPDQSSQRPPQPPPPEPTPPEPTPPEPTPPEPTPPEPTPPEPTPLQTEQPKPRKVFLNYRGDDLPIEFMESLMMKLGKEDISMFIERDELLRGRVLPHIFTRIEQSNVALAIFSKHYAESEWCMEELVKMREHNLVVIPVFYEVIKNDVLTREGDFGDKFAATRQRYEDDPEKIQRWERSLTSIAGDGGIFFTENGNISELVDNIIREVKAKLNMPTYWPTKLVFATALAVCIVMASQRPPHKQISAEWLFGFPIFVAMVWQTICHSKTRMDQWLL